MKLFAIVILLPSLLWAHGEEKPGPHGGHIQMPGAFHTELVLAKDHSAHIYLLDMNFQNPTTKDSQVTVVARNKKSEVKYNCSVMGGNHFHCLPQGAVLPQAELVVKATREKAIGNEAIYKLPLKVFKQTSEENAESHQGH